MQIEKCLFSNSIQFLTNSINIIKISPILFVHITLQKYLYIFKYKDFSYL